MHQGKYIFSQITDFLNKRKFERIVDKRPDKTLNWLLTYWNQLMVLLFGQLQGCFSLRELTDIITYCLVAIIEHKMNLKRNVYEVMRIMSSALLTKENLRDLLEPTVIQSTMDDSIQLSLDF